MSNENDVYTLRPSNEEATAIFPILIQIGQDSAFRKMKMKGLPARCEVAAEVDANKLVFTNWRGEKVAIAFE